MTSMRERIRLVGGHIDLRSAPGMGTRVDVEVPYQPRQQPASSPAWDSPATEVSQGDLPKELISVLMVDDHEVVRQGIRNMIEQTEGISVVGEAADGKAAIEQILAIARTVT